VEDDRAILEAARAYGRARKAADDAVAKEHLSRPSRLAWTTEARERILRLDRARATAHEELLRALGVYADDSGGPS
jgi:hypothetical protein